LRHPPSDLYLPPTHTPSSYPRLSLWWTRSSVSSKMFCEKIDPSFKHFQTRHNSPIHEELWREDNYALNANNPPTLWLLWKKNMNWNYCVTRRVPKPIHILPSWHDNKVSTCDSDRREFFNDDFRFVFFAYRKNYNYNWSGLYIIISEHEIYL